MSLARKLIKLRINHGQTLQQVADAVEVSKTHIWELEKGRASNPTIDLITKLARHFNTSVKSLIEDSEDAFEVVHDQHFFRQFENLTEDDKETLRRLARDFSERRKNK